MGKSRFKGVVGTNGLVSSSPEEEESRSITSRVHASRRNPGGRIASHVAATSVGNGLVAKNDDEVVITKEEEKVGAPKKRERTY